MKKTTLLIITLLILIAGLKAQSPYISKVYDFRPAPGQFINDIPEFEKGDQKEDIIRKVEERIVGEERSIVSLGGYGGYIIFGFDHMIENIEGEMDIRIWGNAFYSNANPNSDTSCEGGSCEPGIVMVAHDANGNGLPDDPWYELAGSEYNKPETIKNYEITYYKPDENKEKTPNLSYPELNDTTYILWKDNQGQQGYISRNVYHDQSYYPLWEDQDSLVFAGTKLADNYVDEGGDGSYFVLYAYPWGYADNHPDADNRSCFDINWAVDSAGNSVELPGIHFVKVYTAVNQYCGRIGETSTEIRGAEDLHLTGSYVSITKPGNRTTFSAYPNPVIDNLHIVSEKLQVIELYNSLGVKLKEHTLAPGHNIISVAEMPSGIYILKADNTVKKIVKK